MANRTPPFLCVILLGVLSFLPFQSSWALIYVSGPAGSGSPGTIGAYTFITPQHFLVGHSGTPTTLGGETVVSSTVISTAASNSADQEFKIAELANPLVGFTPLPLIVCLDLDGNLDYNGLPLRIHGASGGAAAQADYANEVGGGGTYPFYDSMTNTTTNEFVPAVATYTTLPNDSYFFIDVRNQVAGEGKATFGDSNGAVLGNLNGQIGIIGTLAGVIDSDANPAPGSPTTAELNVANFVPGYISEITTYLNDRNAANGTDFSLQILTHTVVPEPSRALLLLVAGMGMMVRRRRA